MMLRFSISYVVPLTVWAALLSTPSADASSQLAQLVYTGYCEVTQYGKLDGNCLSHNFFGCYTKPSADCPAGRRARRVEFAGCQFGSVRFDPKKICHFLATP